MFAIIMIGILVLGLIGWICETYFTTPAQREYMERQSRERGERITAYLERCRQERLDQAVIDQLKREEEVNRYRELYPDRFESKK
jgi:hypothetical protein